MSTPRRLPQVRFDLPIVAAIAVLLPIYLAAANTWSFALVAAASGACLAAVCVVAALRFHDRPAVVRTLLAAAILVPNLSFRTRALGESGLDWQNGLKLVLWGVLLSVTAAGGRRSISLLRTPSALCALSYGVIAIVSSLWSPVPLYTFGSALGLFAWLACAVLAVGALDEDDFVDILFAMLALEVGLALGGALLVPELAWLPPSVEETIYRLQGFSGHPNLLGQHAGLLILVAFMRKGGRGWRMVATIAVALLGCAALIASGSRISLAATATALIYVLCRESGFARRWWRQLVAAALGVCALAAADMLPTSDMVLGGFARTGAASEITTLTGRTDLWAAAWSHILARPLFGWGFNGTEQLMGDSFGKSFAGNAVNAHNLLLQGWLSLGFVGALPGLACLAILVARVVTKPDRRRDCIVVFLFTVGLGEAEFFTTPVCVTFLVFWCLVRDRTDRSLRTLRPSAC